MTTMADEPLPAFDPDYDYAIVYVADDDTVENDCDCDHHADKDED